MAKDNVESYKLVCGIPFSPATNDLMAHLALFRSAPRFQAKPDDIFIRGQQFFYSGAGRFEHAQVVSKLLFPKAFEWHDWARLIVGKACESEWLAVCGCGASSKSTSIGLYSLLWWMSSPLDSAVIAASKTIESAKKRIWREVARFYSAFSNAVGGYRDATIGSSPRPSIAPIVGADRKKDEAHGLFVTALHGKELEKEIGYIKGFHPRRILVVADELDVLEDGGAALIDTFTDNLRTGAQEAQIIVLGNDPSLFNALGDVMQPQLGKPITLSEVEWKSAKNWDCLRLDAYSSPNIRDNDKWTGLVRKKDIDDLVARKGENSPSAWIQLHGIHPPEGSSNTVLSEATLLRFNAFDSVTWKNEFTTSAALDPAFGGDACIYRTFKRGKDVNGNLKILVGDPINIPIMAQEKGGDPADYQIAHKVISLCKDNGVAPDEFAIASTGIGRGVAAILKREWSQRIVEVSEGGAPSDRTLSEEYPVPANKEFDRKVTELWFQCRYFVEADLIRGLDMTTAMQLCGRTYEDIGKGGGRRLSLEKKEDMLHSPDEADCLTCGIELMVLKGVLPQVRTKTKETTQVETEKATEDYDFDASPDSYSDPLVDALAFED